MFVVQKDEPESKSARLLFPNSFEGGLRIENELHLTPFKIGPNHTLYVPPLTIHSNDDLKGTCRTMLSDIPIDHVILERER